jgi:hypothetical protein
MFNAIRSPEMEVAQIKQALREAEEAAYEAADHFFKTQLGGVDQFACGFAWVNIYEHNGEKIKGNTKLGRAMKAAGIKQNWQRTFEIWNPAGYRCQNVDTLEAGARAAADVLKKYGFTAYAGSRLD